MGRMYVPSTPYTRGEKELPQEPVEPGQPADLTLEDVRAAAEAHGYRLEEGAEAPASQPLTEEELEAQADAAGFDLVARPKGNDSAEEWVGYARRTGAVDADLVDGEGKPLGRDALREKFAPKKD